MKETGSLVSSFASNLSSPNVARQDPQDITTFCLLQWKGGSGRTRDAELILGYV